VGTRLSQNACNFLQAFFMPVRKESITPIGVIRKGMKYEQ